MGKKLNAIGNFLVAVCNVYAESKERELEREARDIVYANKKTIGHKELVSAMIEQDWRDWEMKSILSRELSDDQMEAALELIKSGKFRSYQILNVIDKF